MILNLLYMSCCTIVRTTCATKPNNNTNDIVATEENLFDKELKSYVDRILSVDEYNIVPGVQIEPLNNTSNNTNCCINNANTRNLFSLSEYVQKKFDHYLKTHIVSVNLPKTARFFHGNV